MPTMRDVARRAGVSEATVSHVLNGTRFVSEGVRSRVLGAVKDIRYRPNALARSLRRGETRTLGLILPDSANPFFAEVGRGVEDAAFSLGYSVILCNTEGNLDRENLYLDVLQKKQVDGIVFVAAGDRGNSLRPLLDAGMPVIIVDRALIGVEVDAVLTDNRQGGYLATRHLLDLGHRHIGYIGGPSNLTPSGQRVAGYRAALEEAGLAFEPHLVVAGDFHAASGERAAIALLGLPDPPTAFFAGNDMMAIGVLRAATMSGRHVPADLSVVGFDDIELSSYVFPPLTTVAQPKKDVGDVAARMLVERIGNKVLPHRTVMLPTTLVVRDSTRQAP